MKIFPPRCNFPGTKEPFNDDAIGELAITLEERSNSKIFNPPIGDITSVASRREGYPRAARVLTYDLEAKRIDSRLDTFSFRSRTYGCVQLDITGDSKRIRRENRTSRQTEIA